MPSQQKEAAPAVGRGRSGGRDGTFALSEKSSSPSSSTCKKTIPSPIAAKREEQGVIAAPPPLLRREGPSTPRESSPVGVGNVEIPRRPRRGKPGGLSWPVTGCYMLAYNISAGVMSLPHVFGEMGMVPGIFLVNLIGSLGGLTAHTQWRAIMRYDHVRTYPDVLALMFGRPGRWIGNVSMNLIYLFIVSIHILLGVQQWNAITKNGTCQVAFSILSMFLGFCITLVRTLKDSKVLAIAAVASITGAILVTMIGMGISEPPQLVHYLFIPTTLASVWKISEGISSIVFCFTGHIAYPQFIEEMENPEDFPKALLMNQIVMTIVYQIVGAVLYWEGGEHIASPALNSAPDTWRQIAWGMAWPTIQIAATIPMNLLAKNVVGGINCFQRWRQTGSRAVANIVLPPWKIWVPITAFLWVCSFLVAEGIPVFASLVALVGAVLGSWITLGNGAMLHFRIEPDEGQQMLAIRDPASRIEHALPAARHDATPEDVAAEDIPQEDVGLVTAMRALAHQAVENTRRSPWMSTLNILIVVVCVVVCVMGTAGSVALIHEGDRRQPFSCGKDR